LEDQGSRPAQEKYKQNTISTKKARCVVVHLSSQLFRRPKKEDHNAVQASLDKNMRLYLKNN
jgi:hypothetical protein